MKYKYIISTALYISIVIIICGCDSNQHTSQTRTTADPASTTRDSMDNLVGVVTTTEIINYISLPDGYFVKNTDNFTDEYEGFLLENQQEFDSVIGFTKTAKNQAININFDKDVVVAISGKAKTDDVKITVQGILKREHEISFKFLTNKTEAQKSVPVFLLIIPKSALNPNRNMKLDGKKIKLHDTF